MIVENEMKWTMAWFLNQEQWWREKVNWAKSHQLEGHACYGEKQIILWEKMRERCKETWAYNN
jgi:hypothetical protein